MQNDLIQTWSLEGQRAEEEDDFLYHLDKNTDR